MKVFISYSRLEASETAKTIHNYLNEYGHHEVFIDTSDIRGGDEWWKTIQETISDCDIFIIIVTRSALERQYIKEEVELAKKLKKKIIPCISKRYIRNVVLPLDLSKYQGIEYENLDQLIQEMGHMFEYLEKYQRKQPDSTFIDKQNEIPTQNGKKSAIDSPSKEESISYPTAKNTNKKFSQGFQTKIIIILIITVAVIVLIVSINYFNVAPSAPKTITPSDTPKTITPSDTPKTITPSDTTKTITPSDTTKTITPSISDNKTQAYQFIKAWGNKETGDGQLSFPEGVAVDSSTGNVYVSDSGNYRIQKFDTKGNFIKMWGTEGDKKGEFRNPMDIAVDSEGYVYVADSGNNRIQKFDSNGNFIVSWDVDDIRGVAIDSINDVYVTAYNSHNIQKFSNGNFITEWGEVGNKDGQFRYPIGIAVDSKGYVYVADSGNNRIQKFDSNGNFIAKWGSSGTGDGQFNLPYDITIDNSSGYVYISDSWNHRIQKFDSNGNFITKFGSPGTGNGKFSYSAGISIDNSSGNVYVTDNNNRIQVFAPTI